MQTQTEQQNNQAPPPEVFFDEHGNTIPAAAAGEPEADPVAEAAREAGSAESVDASGAAGAAQPPKKFRIGEREFATEGEALEYAQSQVSALTTEAQVADAYRQGIRDAINQSGQQVPGVTPPAAPAVPDLDPQEMYTNPQSFLDKYAQKIKTETLSTLDQQRSVQAQSDQIWREFTDRHPELADFRGEVEAFVQGEQTGIRGIIATKGRPAAYDYISTKMKSRFAGYAAALAPKKVLPNGAGGPSPNQNGAGVTPKTAPKKALSFAEQVQSIRRKR